MRFNHLPLFFLTVAIVSLGEVAAKFFDTSVERAAADLVGNMTTPPIGGPLSLSSIKFPLSQRAKALMTYAHSKLPTTVFNHGRRSFFYAMALLDDPSLRLFPANVIAQARKGADLDETILAITMLHDLALVPEEQFASSASFEYQGGLLARDYLKSAGWPREVIDNVGEGSNLHTDAFLPGRVPLATQAAHLGIGLDAVGPLPPLSQLWHVDTVDAGARAFPRAGWNTYLAKSIKEELVQKPGSHYSIIYVSTNPAYGRLASENPSTIDSAHSPALLTWWSTTQRS